MAVTHCIEEFRKEEARRKKKQVAGQFAVRYRTKTFGLTQILSKENDRKNKYRVLLAYKVAIYKQ